MNALCELPQNDGKDKNNDSTQPFALLKLNFEYVGKHNYILANSFPQFIFCSVSLVHNRQERIVLAILANLFLLYA